MIKVQTLCSYIIKNYTRYYVNTRIFFLIFADIYGYLCVFTKKKSKNI